MPPGPAFGWLCVLHSVTDIAVRAAQIRASQVLPARTVVFPEFSLRKSKAEEHQLIPQLAGDAQANHGPPKPRTDHAFSSNPPINNTYHPEERREELTPLLPQFEEDILSEQVSSTTYIHLSTEPTLEPQLPHDPSFAVSSIPLEADSSLKIASSSEVTFDSGSPSIPTGFESLRREIESSVPLDLEHPEKALSAPIDSPPILSRSLQSSKVPSSRLGRLFHYGSLAASLSYGAASELLRRSTTPHADNTQPVMMTEANITRLVSKLSQMRGAALKLGQFMSIQDTHLLPPEVDKIFRRVQDSAHYMPDWQMQQVLCASLGESWADNFTSFDRIPFAAASIGQVHHAVLARSQSPSSDDGQRVAVKIQFPNIANSIVSDLGYVKMVLTAGSLLPRGLFLDRTIQVMKDELADECNYSREASFLERYGRPDCLGADARFKVPWVWPGSTERVLVMEHVEGVSIGDAVIGALPQEERNEIASRIIELCLRELFQFRLMQTDPNFTNFLWDLKAQQLSLVDFGATREYTKEFMDSWLRLLQAAASEDRIACAEWSQKLEYLTGEENEVMLDAHIDSMVLLATPFKSTTTQPFAFGPGTPWADITAQIRAIIPVMLKHRLTPPPRETYSLNRKLSGAFLLASRLRAVVDTKKLWDQVTDPYKFG
ncbi:ABC1 family-domain-containing protein [Suillus subalutaceus]|uniref:ABC1 family-domain-containing protein n=1 Tax=Suillus subalutaceus TaxID=48586 RepID=UPI001B886BA8|nr:ABC1 family-domain-containing protein [Suillus subalutaceus]KAG1838587.1 ABC1 family-domain-containing protein [Suillus subalutaceus]